MYSKHQGCIHANLANVPSIREREKGSRFGSYLTLLQIVLSLVAPPYGALATDDLSSMSRGFQEDITSIYFSLVIQGVAVGNPPAPCSLA